VALLVLLLFHLEAAAALERCITIHHISYLQGLIQSQWVMAAPAGHKEALPRMVQIVCLDLLALMEEAMAAMAAVQLRATAARVAALQDNRVPEDHQRRRQADKEIMEAHQLGFPVPAEEEREAWV
jgi:hypothetical protein